MTIKQIGGVFGRNPTFNDVDVEGDLTVSGVVNINDINIIGNVDVTGTVTADGLTVGNSNIGSNSSHIANLTIANNGHIGTAYNSTAIQITTTGHVEVTTGNLIIGTAGKGIDFDPAGGGAAKLLDDYEEGIWTPALGGTWTTDPTTLSGTYTKIGRLVSISLYFSGGTKASATTGYFTGLPFETSTSGTGAVTDAGVNDKGIALCQNTDRVWLTETAFNTSTYVVATYTTTE
jgi:hypothetical protein